MERARLIGAIPAVAALESAPFQKVPVRYDKPALGRRFLQPAKEIVHKVRNAVVNSRLDRKALAAAAVTGTIFASACGPISTHSATSPDSYVAEAASGPSNMVGQTIEVGPITADDIEPTKTTCRVTETKNGIASTGTYILDKLGGVPYIVIFVPKEQDPFKTVPGRGTVFAYKEITLQITYENKEDKKVQVKTDKNCPLQDPFFASVDSVSS